MRQEEYARAQKEAIHRPPFRASIGMAGSLNDADVTAEVAPRQPIVKAELERAGALICESVELARQLVERLMPILGAPCLRNDVVAGEKPKDEIPVPPMVHTIREQIAGLMDLVAILRDAASRVEV